MLTGWPAANKKLATTVAACRFHASVHSFHSAMLQPFEQLGMPFTVARREARRQLGLFLL